MNGNPDVLRGPRRTGSLRHLALVGLLTTGGALAGILWDQRTAPPLDSSLARPFQLLGTPIQLVDRLASRSVPVGAVDEQQLGDTFHRRFEAQIEPGDPAQAYLDQLMIQQLRPHAHRPFPYRAYRIGRIGAPNAMALPGGVILVSDELLELLESESELVAILAHELGHIELGHCFDQVRFQLLLKRSGVDSLGAIADAAIQVLVQKNYSKTAEQEADDYSFRLLLDSPYDPAALGRVFGALNRLERGSGGAAEREASRHADLLRDALATHPPGPLRQAEYEQRATAWQRSHPGEQRQQGVENLRQRRPLPDPRVPQATR
jgi:predicted Zn-dependent protease